MIRSLSTTVNFEWIVTKSIRLQLFSNHIHINFNDKINDCYSQMEITLMNFGNKLKTIIKSDLVNATLP